MKKVKLFSTILLLSLFFISSALIGCNSSSSSIDYGNINGNISNGGCLVGNTEYVFFIKPKKNYGITRMNQDGTDIVQVTSDDAHWMNLYENKLYYIQDNDQCIYRMNLDVSSCNIISTTKAYYMIVAHDTIYFLNPEDDYALYSMNLDGSKETKLTENEAERINVVHDQIYYISPSDNYHIYQMDIDGTNKKLFLAESCRLLVATNDYLFYSTIEVLDKGRVRPKGIHRITRSDPSEVITIQEKGGMSGITVQENSFFYVDDDTVSFVWPIMKSTLMGDNSNIVLEGYCGLPEVSGDWILLLKTLVPWVHEVDKDHFGDKQDSITMLYNQVSQEWISIEEPLY